MVTSAVDSLAAPLDGSLVLVTALQYWPDRWSPHTIATAMSLEDAVVRSLSPGELSDLLDRIEAALAPIAASIAPAQSARRLRLGARLQ